MNELALFAGTGGGILGGLLHGWRTVAAVEIEDYPRRVLLQRQADGVLPRFPIWDDVRTFDGEPWRGRVDVITGGFPCQDISAAGKGAGITGSRSGLWGHMARIIGDVRPRYAFVENSPLLVSRGLDTVLADLAEIGYDAVWTVLGADDVGAPHRRKRIWILAYANSSRGNEDSCKSELRPGRAEQSSSHQGVASAREDAQGSGRVRWWHKDPADLPETSSERPTQPGLGGVADGLADRMDFAGASAGMVVPRLGHGIPERVNRLKAIGNGQVAMAAAVAWEELIIQMNTNRREK